MLRLLSTSEQHLIKDDPVRPHFTYKWRTSSGREVWVLERDDHIAAIICVAYTNEIPTNEFDLEYFSQAATQEGGLGTVAVFYTVWSYEKGAGRDIVNSLAKHLRSTRPYLTRWVTLSPLTEMAERFHLSNGAILLDRHSDCQNFDYTHTLV